MLIVRSGPTNGRRSCSSQIEIIIDALNKQINPTAPMSASKMQDRINELDGATEVLRTILSLSSASQITRVGIVMESLSRSLAYLRRDVAGYVLSETAESGQPAESAESPARQIDGIRDLPGELQNANRPETAQLVR